MLPSDPRARLAREGLDRARRRLRSARLAVSDRSLSGLVAVYGQQSLSVDVTSRSRNIDTVVGEVREETGRDVGPECLTGCHYEPVRDVHHLVFL